MVLIKLYYGATYVGGRRKYKKAIQVACMLELISKYMKKAIQESPNFYLLLGLNIINAIFILL